MGALILLDARLFAVGADFSGVSNKIELSAEHEVKDRTNYRSGGYKEVKAGIASAEITAEGQWEAGDPSLVDNASWAALGGTGPYTACAEDSIVGALAYFMNGMRQNFKFGDAVGEINPWSGTVKSSWPLVRGQIAHPPGTPRTVTGTGTALNLGAVAAGKRLYAALHVLSVAGTSTPTITARVESDDAAGMSSPTTRLTFGAATAVSGEILRSDGTAITDTHYRLAWTISGTTPSFMFAAAIGIQ